MEMGRLFGGVRAQGNGSNPSGADGAAPEDVQDKLSDILRYLRAERGLDVSGYRTSMLERRVALRASAVGCRDGSSYLAYLRCHPEELDRLIGALAIHVSWFFRDPLTFEYLTERLLPRLVRAKIEQGDPSLRFWSAGCASGEEAYSIAILIREALKKTDRRLNVHIFATDITEDALKRARRGVYPLESVREVKYGLLKEYFRPVRPEGGMGTGRAEEWFQVIPEIRDMVSFSIYDILDRKTIAPPDSIFGAFDLILCRNLMIYFNLESQDGILTKLFRSLSPGGYLILGEAEVPTPSFEACLIRVDACCHVYQKG